MINCTLDNLKELESFYFSLEFNFKPTFDIPTLYDIDRNEIHYYKWIQLFEDNIWVIVDDYKKSGVLNCKE